MQARHVYANVLKATAAVVLTATLTPHAFAIDPKADTDGEAAKFVANYQITKVGLRSRISITTGSPNREPFWWFAFPAFTAM